jgi:hypothetical protein
MKISNYKSGSVHAGSNLGPVGYKKIMRSFKRLRRRVVCELSIGLLVKAKHTSGRSEMLVGFWLEHLEEEDNLEDIGIVGRIRNGY